MSKKRKNIVTPKGIASWPRLNSPDTKWNADGVYKTGLVLTPEESEDLRETLDTIAEEGWKKAIEEEKKPAAKKKLQKFTYQPPYKPEEDEEGNETGNYVFNFKTNATYKDRSTGESKKKNLTLVDAKKNPVGELVGSGSTIRVSFTPGDYQMPSAQKYGVACYLDAVQVLELVAVGGGGVDVFDEEDGFESEEDPTDAEDVKDDDGDEDDF